MDIRRVLDIPHADKLIYYPRRSNLDLRSEPFIDDFQIFNKIKNTNGSVIVYCATIKKVETFGAALQDFLGGTEVTLYHGQLNPDVKRTNQDLFMSGGARIVIATNAFGMGVDHPTIRGVFHRDIPGSIEAVSQEQGRAGRDGKYSECTMYMDPRSLSTQEFFIRCGYPAKEDVIAVYNVLKKSVDNMGIAKMPTGAMAEKAGISVMQIHPILSILVGAKAIERTKQTDKIAQIKFVGNLATDKFVTFKHNISKGGESVDNGYIELDLNWLSTAVDLGLPTVTNYLKQWAKEGVIEYNPPFRGSPTKVIGPVSNVDFARLKDKALLAYEKLDEVKKYCATPDKDKHKFLEDYFQIVPP